MVSHECALPFAFCIEKALQFLYCIETNAIISFCSITSLPVQLWGFSASANNDIIHDILQKVAAIPCGLSSPSRRIEIGTRNHADLFVLRKTSKLQRNGMSCGGMRMAHKLCRACHPALMFSSRALDGLLREHG